MAHHPGDRAVGAPQRLVVHREVILAHLAGTEIPISGRVHRVHGRRMTIELDLMIDEFVGTLEGYLTRAQLLDILC